MHLRRKPALARIEAVTPQRSREALASYGFGEGVHRRRPARGVVAKSRIKLLRKIRGWRVLGLESERLRCWRVGGLESGELKKNFEFKSWLMLTGITGLFKCLQNIKNKHFFYSSILYNVYRSLLYDNAGCIAICNFLSLRFQIKNYEYPHQCPKRGNRESCFTARRSAEGQIYR